MRRAVIGIPTKHQMTTVRKHPKFIDPNNDEFSEAQKTLEKAMGKMIDHKYHPKSLEF